jgi:hypothetical protein
MSNFQDQIISNSLMRREKKYFRFSVFRIIHFRKKQAIHPCQKVVNGQAPKKKKIYDDELVRVISEEFSNRIRTVPIFGDIIRAVRLSMRRKIMSFDDFLNLSIDEITSQLRVSRFDIA